MNPYRQFVAEFVRLHQEGKSLPLGGLNPEIKVAVPEDAPAVLVFSPHPDDECIIGGLPLRLLREARMRVVNVAVTQGSIPQRQAERFQELTQACDYLGFECVQTQPNGLQKIRPHTREQDPESWGRAVGRLREILEHFSPTILFCPHREDWNSTHIATHLLVLDALHAMPVSFSPHVVETEFWGQMTTPNLLVESTVNDVADLVTGISFHAGEVRRNPYHLLLPAWMQDNVRRGCELVGGQGGPAPGFIFATVYRLSRWAHSRFEKAYESGRFLAANENPSDLFSS